LPRTSSAHSACVCGCVLPAPFCVPTFPLLLLADPLEGTILLDGRDIRQYNIKWLRSQVRTKTSAAACHALQKIHSGSLVIAQVIQLQALWIPSFANSAVPTLLFVCNPVATRYTALPTNLLCCAVLRRSGLSARSPSCLLAPWQTTSAMVSPWLQAGSVDPFHLVDACQRFGEVLDVFPFDSVHGKPW
jgi:hypothetical protein